MGRQAKLKKNRDRVSASPPPSDAQPTQFVKDLKRQGYNLQQAQRSPELPDNHPEPQL